MYYKIKDPVKEPVKARSCDVCGTSYIPRANHQRFCGSNCRLANWSWLGLKRKIPTGLLVARKLLSLKERGRSGRKFTASISSSP